jgi:hypothetical protein
MWSRQVRHRREIDPYPDSAGGARAWFNDAAESRSPAAVVRLYRMRTSATAVNYSPATIWEVKPSGPTGRSPMMGTGPLGGTHR